MDFVATAHQYARTLKRSEKFFLGALQSEARHERLLGLRRGAGYFGIARNFPLAFDVALGVQRLAPVLDLIESPPYRSVSAGTVLDQVKALRSQLAELYGGKDRLSAATKFLWMVHRTPIVIYDERARRALRASRGDYEHYWELWHSGYESCQEAIAVASETLKPDVPEALEEWFHERVYDLSLWNSEK
jgi:hypothetical protein